MNEWTWNCTSLWLQREHVITAFMVENAIIKDARQGPFHTFSAWDFVKLCLLSQKRRLQVMGLGFSSARGRKEGEKGFQIFVIRTQMKPGLSIGKSEGKTVPELKPTSQG